MYIEKPGYDECMVKLKKKKINPEKKKFKTFENQLKLLQQINN